MKRALPLASSLLLVVVLAACSTTTKPSAATHGFDLTGMNAAVNACDDFYTHAVGKWRETHPLDPQYARFGRFEEVAERNRLKLREILDADAANTSAPKGSTEQKVGDFYAACMNEAAIEARRHHTDQPRARSHQRHQRRATS